MRRAIWDLIPRLPVPPRRRSIRPRPRPRRGWGHRLRQQPNHAELDRRHRQRRGDGLWARTVSGGDLHHLCADRDPERTTYNDTGLLPSTTYQYQVRATDAAGNFSGYSNIASATAAAATGLVDAYAFTEGTSITTADLSGNGHAGTLINGPAWVAGQASHGTALSFDGVDDELAVTNPSTFNFGTQDFTLDSGRNATSWTGISSTSSASSTMPPQRRATKSSTSRPTTCWPSARQHRRPVEHDHGSQLASLHGHAQRHDERAQDLHRRRADDDGDIQSHSRRRRSSRQFGTLKSGAQNNTFSGTLDDVRIYRRVLSAAEVVTDMNTPVSPPGPDTTPPTARERRPRRR